MTLGEAQVRIEKLELEVQSLKVELGAPTTSFRARRYSARCLLGEVKELGGQSRPYESPDPGPLTLVRR